MFTDRKTQYWYDVSSSQLNLQIQHNPNQSPRKLFCGYQLILKFTQKAQNSQLSVEEE